MCSKDLEDVKVIKRRLFQPKRVYPRVATARTDGERGGDRLSVCKLDCDSVMDTVHQLIERLKKIEVYKPYDSEFTIEALQARLSELQALNFAAMQAKLNLCNARIARDEVLDGAGGVVEVTTAVKNYVRAKFGYFSGEARMMRG